MRCTLAAWTGRRSARGRTREHERRLATPAGRGRARRPPARGHRGRVVGGRARGADARRRRRRRGAPRAGRPTSTATSWEAAPPGSWGRPIAMLRCRLMAGDTAGARADAESALAAGALEATGPIGGYCAALALLVLGRDEEAGRVAGAIADEGLDPVRGRAGARRARARRRRGLRGGAPGRARDRSRRATRSSRTCPSRTPCSSSTRSRAASDGASRAADSSRCRRPLASERGQATCLDRLSPSRRRAPRRGPSPPGSRSGTRRARRRDSSSRIAAIVVPPGEVTISRSSTGWSFSSRSCFAVPSIVWTTSWVEISRERPSRRPASIIASARSAKYAGPEPETAVTASMWRSGTRTTEPRWASASSASVTCASSACAPAQSPAIPSCTVDGVFGIARTTGTPAARWRSIVAVGVAAATVRTVCSGVIAVPISPSSASMSCGLTATTTSAAPAAASTLLDVTCDPVALA